MPSGQEMYRAYSTAGARTGPNDWFVSIPYLNCQKLAGYWARPEARSLEGRGRGRVRDGAAGAVSPPTKLGVLRAGKSEPRGPGPS